MRQQIERIADMEREHQRLQDNQRRAQVITDAMPTSSAESRNPVW